MSFQGTKPSFNTPPKTAFQIKILILFEAFLCQKKDLILCQIRYNQLNLTIYFGYT